VTTIKSSEDFETLIDKLSALLWHSHTVSQQSKFPNELKSTTEPGEHAALYNFAQNDLF
jgi:hypothetical protein